MDDQKQPEPEQLDPQELMDALHRHLAEEGVRNALNILLAQYVMNYDGGETSITVDKVPEKTMNAAAGMAVEISEDKDGDRVYTVKVLDRETTEATQEAPDYNNMN